MAQEQVLKILVVHPEAVTRRELDERLRRARPDAVVVYEAPSLAQGLESSRRYEPDVIFLDLGQERELALEVAADLQHPARRIVGLYNPLVLRGGEVDFLRRAARAGVGDFIPLPAADAEVAEALEAAVRATGRPEERREGQLTAFYSPKGGVGTTTLAVNSALLLTGDEESEREVALCDAVLQFGDAAALLGVTPELDLADLARALDDPGALPGHLARHEETGLRLLASPADPRAAEEITPEQLSRALIGLRRRYPQVVVDTPSTLDLMTLAVLDLAETIFVVTEAVAPTVVTTARCLELLAAQGLGGGRIRVVLNRYAPRDEQLSERAVSEYLGRPLDHVVPHDGAAIDAANRGEPLVLSRGDSRFGEALAALADELLAPLPL